MAVRHRTLNTTVRLVRVVLSVPTLIAILLVAPASASTGSGALPLSEAYPEVPPGTYEPPVDAPVSDPFRLEHGPYGAGNRGLEYATTPAQPVRAVAAGRIAFAGPVAGRLVVSIDHPDGRRSSLTGLTAVAVRVGDLVARGTVVGTAGSSLHLGLREGSRYVDPAQFFTSGSRRAVLVPVGRRPGSD